MVNFQNLIDNNLLQKYHDQLEETELKPIKSAVGLFIDTNGHEYVDFELPSGNLWAKTNIGATNPEDYGLYFAWGETTGYADIVTGTKEFRWSDYEFNPSGDGQTFTKYNATDDKVTLDAEDDVVQQQMGGDWYIPTKEDLIELFIKTDSELTTLNGVNGRKFMKKSDHSIYIFIPFAGNCIDGSHNVSVNTYYLWTSSRVSWSVSNAWGTIFSNMISANSRYAGFSVRGVCKDNSKFSKKADKVQNCTEGNFPILDATGNLLDSGKKPESFALKTDLDKLGDKYYEKKQSILIEEDGIYQIKDNSVYPVAHPDLSTQPSILPQRFGNLDIKEVLIRAGHEDEIPKGAMVISAFSFNDHECCPATVKWVQPTAPATEGYVDLGLPSGTLWATKNLGAASLEEYGLYYAWGETTGYPDVSTKQFSWSDYKFGTSGSLTKYNDSDGKTVLDSEDDAVYVATNGIAHMPTKSQLNELYKSTTWEQTTVNGVNGVKFTGTNDSYIFIPAAGYYTHGSLYGVGSYYHVWSSSRHPDASWACYLNFTSGVANVDFADRCSGRSIRGVVSAPSAHWSITNEEGVDPDYTLIRYVENNGGGYYYNPEPSREEVVFTTRILGDGSNTNISNLNCEDIWGIADPKLNVGDQIGYVKILRGTSYVVGDSCNLVVSGNGPGTIANVVERTSIYLYMERLNGNSGYINYSKSGETDGEVEIHIYKQL